MKSQKSAEHEKSTVSVQQKTAKEPSSQVVYRTISFSENFVIPIHLLNTLKYEYLRRELWVPLEHRGGRITVLVDDPGNILKRDMIENLFKTKAIEYCVASKADILNFIDHFYGIDDAGELLSSNKMTDAAGEGEAVKEEQLAVAEEDSKVVVNLVNDLIHEAYVRRASDIHIEPDIKDRVVNVRFRIDGECIPYKTLPYEYRSPIVSRVKIMSNLDITERRLPQDGKIKYSRPGAEEMELRVATLPTHGYVEDVVLRILTRGKIMVLDELQMEKDTRDRFKAIMKKPYGLILLVGPTGSGKTTTAHAALHLINKPNMKIWTVEDPVEITQQGIRQVQAHHKIGLDFSSAMRAFLRADPDVIMVGEMRDYETAKMGIEASTTGHLVLSTLHTNNAPETIVRLLDIGIDPFAFADSLLCVLAQRLVRCLCGECRESYHPVKEEFDDLVRHYGEQSFSSLNITYDDDFTLYRAKGCPECNNTGYRGMTGLFELLVATDAIKQMIIGRKSIAAIRKSAMNEGMHTLLQGGILKVLRGETDFIEVLSVCIR
jgi:type II secretory ATPase GspE/PulE/Tfp pilus assembly ATPase PilB-like protein